METLEQALERIAELEGQVSALAGERDAAAGRARELELVGERDAAAGEGRLAEAAEGHAATELALRAAHGALADANGALAEVNGALAVAKARGLAHLRRALLAEHAGRIVPELVAGDGEEALLASVEVAQQAYARILEAARPGIERARVPMGAPSARGAAVAGGLSPLELIESGLRR